MDEKEKIRSTVSTACKGLRSRWGPAGGAHGNADYRDLIQISLLVDAANSSWR
jgi:hypothetical protein